ncbi:hypothetical protein F5Y08DRAFT_45046 [Xylaria arbuscula]|nr:hypothetical protein F5Y08DRAFT_45046 [Xylaria arbuscula]
MLGFQSAGQMRNWLMTSGVLIGFSIFSALHLLPIQPGLCSSGDGRDGALAGECFYFLKTYVTRLGISAHLYCILPASTLAGFQFLPVSRRGVLLRVHRAVGYASLILGLVGSIASLPIIRHTFGGSLTAQSASGMLLILFVGAQVMAWTSIRQKKVRDHELWMLRSWVYASSIITMRVIMILAAICISWIGGYYLAMPCDKIAHILRSRDETLRWYPECAPFFTGLEPSRKVIVDANIAGTNRVQFSAAFNLSYGLGAWLGLFLHVVGIDIYIQHVRRPLSPNPQIKTNIDSKSQSQPAR